jgi:cation diffusion facilitator family transporter
MQESIRAQKWILWAGIAILLIKFGAWYITGSNAILSDTLESVINVLAAGLALYSLNYAAQPADADHPYGHGKVEYVTSGIEGGLILAAGVMIIGKGVYNLIFPLELESMELGTYLSGGAGMVNYLLAYYLVRVAKSSKSIVLRAEAAHLRSDAYSSFAMILGLIVLILTGWTWLDNVIAMAFGILIISSGIKLIRESLAGIMDEADEELLQELESVLRKNRRENWIDLHDVRIMRNGNDIHVDGHMTLPYFLSFEQAHQENQEMQNRVRSAFAAHTEFFIHFDPCHKKECSWCIHSKCSERTESHREDRHFLRRDKVLD